MLVLFIIIHFFILGLESCNFYINNEYQESYFDGSENFPFKSFSEAFAYLKIQDQHNETIFFTILSNNEEYEFNDKILFNENIVILYKSPKNEKAQLMALSNSQFIVLFSLHFENIILKIEETNFNSNENEYKNRTLFFLEENSTLTFQGCVIANISDISLVMSNENSSLNVIDTYFQNITIKSHIAFITAKSSCLYFTSLSLISNSFQKSNFLKAYQTTILFTNSSIIYNYFYEEIAFDCNECNIFIESSSIENNYLKNSGLLYFNGNKEFIFMINSTKIKKNYVNIQFLNVIGIFSTVQITNCEFSANNISNIIFIQNSQKGNLYFMNLLFEKNNAKQIIIVKTTQNILINSVIFSYNNWLYKDVEVGLIGPCMLFENVAGLKIEKLEILENIGMNNMVGVVIVQSKDLLVSNLTIQNLVENFLCFNNYVIVSDKSEYEGNCLLLNSFYETNLKNSTFRNNSIIISGEDQRGGNPCVNTMNYFNILYILDSFFYNNEGFDQSNCINFAGIKIFINNSHFEGMRPNNENHLLENLGTVMISAEISLIYNSKFFNNRGSKAGGIFFNNLHSKFSSHYFYCENLIINNNTATQTAALEFDVSLSNGVFKIINSEISYNNVSFYSAVSSFHFSEFNLQFLNCKFMENVGKLIGATYAALHFGGEVNFEACVFSKNLNYAENRIFGGPAIVIYGIFSTRIYSFNCTYIENISFGRAGVILIFAGQFYDNFSSYIKNRGNIGGIICVWTWNNLILSNVHSFNNSAIDGGAIYASGAILKIIKSSFELNSAQNGAAVFYNGVQNIFSIENSSFENNNGKTVIELLSNEIKSTQPFILSNCIFIQNNAKENLIMILNINLLFENNELNSNQGRIMTLADVFFTSYTININNQKCFSNMLEGCVCNILSESIVNITNISIANLYSEYLKDIFVIYDSKILFSNIQITNISCFSDYLLIYTKNSEIEINYSIIKNLSKGLAHLEDNSKITINNSQFYDVVLEKNLRNPAFLCDSCDKFILERILVNKCLANSDTCFSLISKGNLERKINNFLVINSAFIHSSNTYGGVFSIVNQKIKFSNNLFQKNFGSFGGVFYFDCQITKEDCIWNLSENTFKDNAGVKGSVYYTKQGIPLLSQNYLDNNNEKSGEIFYGFPLYLGLRKIYDNGTNTILNCKNSTDNCCLNEIASGQSFNLSLTLFDVFDHIMTIEQGFASIDLIKNEYSSNETYKLLGAKTSSLLNGHFTFSDMFIEGKPNSSASLIVTTNLLPKFQKDYLKKNNFHQENNNGSYSLVLPAKIRQCERGEIYKRNQNICYKCPKNQYSLDIFDSDCKACPDNAFCEGGDRIILDFGYWRSSVTSDLVYQCSAFSKSCLGGYNSSCSEGYSGVLCSVCSYEQGNYFFRKGDYYCEKCNYVWIYLLIMFGFFAIILFFIKVMISQKNENEFKYILIKIITTHFQTLIFVANLNINLVYMPDFLLDIYGFQSILSSFNGIFSLGECFRESLGFSSHYTMKLWFSVIMQFAILLFVIIFWVIYGKRKKYNKEKIKYNLINSLVIIFNFIQPGMINFYIQNLSCVELDGESYLSFNLAQKCWFGSHLIYSLVITLPMLFNLAFIYPLSCFLYLYENKEKPQKTIILSKFFILGYKRDKYYWEFIQITRKFSIIFLTNLMMGNVSVTTYLLIFLLSLFLFLHFNNHPYENQIFNSLESISLITCFLTYYFSFYYLKITLQSTRLLAFCMILLLNCFFLFKWGIHYLKIIKDYYRKARQFIKKKYSNKIFSNKFKSKKPKRIATASNASFSRKSLNKKLKFK